MHYSRCLSPHTLSFSTALICSLLQVSCVAARHGSPSSITDPGSLQFNTDLKSAPLFKPGDLIYSRDIIYRIRQLRRRREIPAVRTQHRMLENSVRSLQDGLRRWPQAVRFRIAEDRAGLRIQPVDWQDRVSVHHTVRTGLVIIGGEFESVVMAVAAADRGIPTALVYAGPLGGLCSDSGGNLRYFDGLAVIPRPPEQLRLFRMALGMDQTNLWTLPRGVSQKLLAFLRSRYADRITLIRTRTYNSIHLEQHEALLTAITTGEGVRLEAADFLDTDPESRVAEKAGIPMSVVTPNLSYGLVFDAAGLTPIDWLKLDRPGAISPDDIVRLAGLTIRDLPSGSAARKSCQRLRRLGKHDPLRRFTHTRFGYSSLAEGFNLYMQCRGLRDPNPGLAWLNRARCTSGFNVSMPGGGDIRATFNSMSYHFDTSILQEDHDLLTDPALCSFREVERPGLESYFRAITGDRGLRVILPRQFYVRKASAYFQTLRPYGAVDFSTRPRGSLWMLYEMDLRDALPRSEEERQLLARSAHGPRGRVRWECRASAAATRVRNLYLVNKSAMTPEYYGGLRILQNLINTGVAVVDQLAAKGPSRLPQ